MDWYTKHSYSVLYLLSALPGREHALARRCHSRRPLLPPWVQSRRRGTRAAERHPLVLEVRIRPRNRLVLSLAMELTAWETQQPHRLKAAQLSRCQASNAASAD